MKAYRKNIESYRPATEQAPAPKLEPKPFTPAQDARVNFMRNILIKARPYM
jgi:hypothetical protein